MSTDGFEEADLLDNPVLQFVKENFEHLQLTQNERGVAFSEDYLVTDDFFMRVFGIISSILQKDFNQEQFLDEIQDLEPGQRFQVLLDLVQQQNFIGNDLSYIKGLQIVGGNPHHVCNLFRTLYMCSAYQPYDYDEYSPIDDTYNDSQGQDLQGKQQKSLRAEFDYTEEEPALEPRKFDTKKRVSKISGRKKKAKRPRSMYTKYGRVPPAKPRTKKKRATGIKKPIVETIEKNIYGSRKLTNRKTLRPYKGIKNQMPLLTMESQMQIMDQLQMENAMEELADDQLYLQTQELRKTLQAKGVGDRQIEEMLMRQKRKYMYSLYDYMNFIRRKEEADAQKVEKARTSNHRSKMKALQIYKDKVQEDLQNEALSMKYKLRDEQVNYMRAISKGKRKK